MSTYTIKISDPKKVKRVGDQIKFSTTYDQFNRFHIKEIEWSFGDGSKSTKINPQHRYTTSGRKEVKCVINRMYKLRKVIVIVAPPQVDNEPEPEPEIPGVRLRVINNSNNVSGLSIIIFQKNVATIFDERATAWIYVENLNPAGIYSFTFGSQLRLLGEDSSGNFTMGVNVNPGESYLMVDSSSGTGLVSVGSASSPREIELVNGLPNGNATANIYRSGKLLGQKTGIGQSQKGVFEFKPTIWIGIASGLTEGQELDSMILSSINTELSLLGIASADIIVTGGGAGPSSTPFSFSLENIIYA